LTYATPAHINFVGGDENLPIIISVLTTPNNGELTAIFRTKTDTVVRPIPAVPNKKDKILKQVRESFAEELKDARLVEVKDPAIEKDLSNMEDRMLVKHYSFGVLYCKSGQKSEDEIFSNKEDDVSQAYIDFLSFIGDRVKLEGFPGPKVGLDTKSTSCMDPWSRNTGFRARLPWSFPHITKACHMLTPLDDRVTLFVTANTTGTHTYYTRFNGFEIVYHVATCLPWSEANAQQLERKRHIGNDVVSIIFQDGPDTFDPSVLTTKFTHVIAVVQHYTDDQGRSRYKFAIANKPGVREYGPVNPNVSWKLGNTFREFLLTKLINGERAAYYSPGFALSRTRRMWLWEIVCRYMGTP
jgi:RAP1 GTPase activating protein 1